MPDKVLVAFDESPQATEALRHALSFYPNASISVLYVQDPTEWIFGDTVGGAYYSEEGFQESQERAEELLQQAGAIAEEYDNEVTTHTEVGQPTREIVSFAEKQNVEHLVIGSHGRRGLERFLLGSVAESVIKRSPVSITIIREENEE